MSYKPRQKVEGKWYPNGLAFETHGEAEQSARSTFSHWFTSEGWDVVESDERPNYKIVDGAMVEIVYEEESKGE